MSLNQIGYLVNPSIGKTVGASRTTDGTSTVYTGLANDKVTGFCITATSVGTGGTDYNTVIVTIGTAKYVIVIDSTTGIGLQTIRTGTSLNFNGSFLQVGDTITVQT